MKTIKAYKLFQTKKSAPGELFPLFIGKSEPTPQGEWIEAQHIPTKGYAPRPGWHAGSLPMAPHLMKKDGSMPSNRVWCEVELPADVDWQPIADSQGGEIKGEVPRNGYYRFKRPGLQGGEWLIAGALKICRILSADDVAQILAERDTKVSTTKEYFIRGMGVLTLCQTCAIKLAFLQHTEAQPIDSSSCECEHCKKAA